MILGRVRDGPGGARSRCRATRTEEAVARTASFLEKWHGRLDGRHPGVGHAVLAGDVQRRPPARRSSAWRTSTGPGSRSTTEAAPRRGRSPWRGTGSAPTEYLESIGRPRPERAPGPRARPRRRRDRVPGPHAAPRSRCAPSPPPRAAAGSPSTAGCRSSSAKGVKVALGCDSPNNSNHLDMVRDHEHGGHPVQGRAPGHAPDPGRAGARDGHAPRRAGARARRRARLDRAGQARRPRPLRHRSARSGRPSSTRSTTSSTTPTAAACTR